MIMKSFATPRWILTQVFLALSCLLVAPIKAQTIQIDSTFTADGEIFPFENIEIISGLSAGGEVDLNSDTSLVRIILVDENDIHYLVFETYPLICDSLDFVFTNHCDETCSLDQIHPYSLIIQVIDAELELKDLNYETDPKQDPESLRYQAKRDKDFEKIEALNQNIPRYGMNWTAGDNGVVEKYYDQKRLMFGDGYNLLGYDYYSGGVFEFLGHFNYPQIDPEIVHVNPKLKTATTMILMSGDMMRTIIAVVSLKWILFPITLLPIPPGLIQRW
jgi:hypothetical protein